MMEKQNLRRADFITAVVLIVFSIWELAMTFRMPMKDSWGGVQNVWFVSPALFPLIIGSGLLLLGIVLLAFSIRTGGYRSFVEQLHEKRKGLSEPSIRFLAILLAFVAFVYFLIPRVDFFLANIIFLFYFIAAFYFDDVRILHSLARVFLAGMVLFLLVFVTGIGQIVNGLFRYSTDVLALLFFIGYALYARTFCAGDERLRKKFRITLIVSLAVPLFLVPVFKYFLLVPLPVEGGIIGIMNLIRYSF